MQDMIWASNLFLDNNYLHYFSREAIFNMDTDNVCKNEPVQSSLDFSGQEVEKEN
jgi:hypothetical protein